MIREAAKWLRKADRDLKVARRELESENPVTEAVCFHAQQAVEKYLKAFLVYHNRPFRKTHDIAELLHLCIKVDKSFEKFMNEKVVKLTVYSVDTRYPGALDYEPTPEEAREAVEIAERVRDFVLKKLKAGGGE